MGHHMLPLMSQVQFDRDQRGQFWHTLYFFACAHSLVKCYICFVVLYTIITGNWHSGSASALHAEGLGFNPRILHAVFEWSRVRLTLGAPHGTYSSVVERSIAEDVFCKDPVLSPVLLLGMLTYIDTTLCMP